MNVILLEASSLKNKPETIDKQNILDEESSELLQKFSEKFLQLKENIIKEFPFFLVNNLRGKHKTKKIKKIFGKSKIIKPSEDIKDIIIAELQNISLDYTYFNISLPQWKSWLAEGGAERLIEDNKDQDYTQLLMSKIDLFYQELKKLQEIRNKIIINNQNLVYHVISEKMGNSIEVNEKYFSEGIKGLIYAVENFDSSKKIKFGNYAANVIHSFLLTAYNNTQDNSKIGALAKEYAAIYSEHQKKYGKLEVKKALGKLNINLKTLQQIQEFLVQKEVSLDESIFRDNTGKEKTWHDILSEPEQPTVENQVDLKEKIEIVKRILNKNSHYLNDRERTLLELKYKYDIDNPKIGKQFLDTSKQRVSQLHKRILDKIQKALEEFDVEIGGKEMYTVLKKIFSRGSYLDN